MTGYAGRTRAGQATSAHPHSGSAKVSPDAATTLRLADGLAVSVPRGTVAGQGLLAIQLALTKS
jgi:hypothetical protein